MIIEISHYQSYLNYSNKCFNVYSLSRLLTEVWRLSESVSVWDFKPECDVASQGQPLNCFSKSQFNVQALYCTRRRGQSLSFTFPALLLSLLYKLIQKKHPKKWIILPRMPREGCTGSLIQQLGYVNKQFVQQRDDMTKELWRQNWISFDRMWLPLRLIDFHHRHIVEAFTTWNWEESVAIERKWQSNTNNGVS